MTLFNELGPAAAAFLRLALAASVLWAISRPRLTGDLRLAGAFGVALGLMNWSFYEATDRIPLGVAVTIEFTGPLLVAAIGSRRPLDGVWIALAAAGIVVLVDPGGGSVDTAGVGFALVAAGCWMAYIYLSKRTGAAIAGTATSPSIVHQVFRADGSFAGTETLIRADMFAGQSCPADQWLPVPPWLPTPTYYACHHFEFTP